MNLVYRSERRAARPHDIDNAHQAGNPLSRTGIRALQRSVIDKPANADSEQENQGQLDLLAALAMCLALTLRGHST